MAPSKQQKLQDTNTRLEEIYKGCYINLYDKLVDQKTNKIHPSLDFDGVHLNDAGHQVIYDQIIINLKNQYCVSFAMID